MDDRVLDLWMGYHHGDLDEKKEKCIANVREHEEKKKKKKKRKRKKNQEAHQKRHHRSRDARVCDAGKLVMRGVNRH